MQTTSDKKTPPLEEDEDQNKYFIGVFLVAPIFILMLTTMLNSLHSSLVSDIEFLESHTWQTTTIDFNNAQYHYVFEDYRKNKRRWFSVYKQQQLIYEVSCTAPLVKLCNLLEKNAKQPAQKQILQRITFYESVPKTAQQKYGTLTLKSFDYFDSDAQPQQIIYSKNPPDHPQKISKEKWALAILTFFVMWIFLGICYSIRRIKELPKVAKWFLSALFILNGIYLVLNTIHTFI